MKIDVIRRHHCWWQECIWIIIIAFSTHLNWSV